MEFNENEILSLIPKGVFDPSEVVLIGSHMEPDPPAEGEEADTSTTLGRARPTDRAEALRQGWMHLRSDFAALLVFMVDSKTTTVDGKSVETKPAIALIYAYGYEGHVYRLPKPRIMIVHGEGEPYEAGRSADPSEALIGKLYMWRMSKHDHTVSIEVESGAVEKLVLEANQPGNRSVNAYAAHMQMSHRGGKLGG